MASFIKATMASQLQPSASATVRRPIRAESPTNDGGARKPQAAAQPSDDAAEVKKVGGKASTKKQGEL